MGAASPLVWDRQSRSRRGREGGDAGLVEEPQGGEEVFECGFVGDAVHEVAEGSGTVRVAKEFQHVAGELEGELGEDALDFQIDGEDAVEGGRLGWNFFPWPEADGGTPFGEKCGLIPWRFGGGGEREQQVALDGIGDNVEQDGQLFGIGGSEGVHTAERESAGKNAGAMETGCEMQAIRAQGGDPIAQGKDGGAARRGARQGVSGKGGGQKQGGMCGTGIVRESGGKTKGL